MSERGVNTFKLVEWDSYTRNDNFFKLKTAIN